MKRQLSAFRTLTRRLGLSLAGLAGHTVRYANVAPALAGFALMSWGAAMIYVPAGWICGGASLLLIGRELNAAPAAPRGGE
jgi:hypothetical protein